MSETRLDLGAAARPSEPRKHAYVPLQWFRRRKILLGIVFLVVTALFWLHATDRVPLHPWASRAVDPDVARLLREVPGAVPGVPAPPHDSLKDAGHAGKSYPSREDLTLLFLSHLREPSFAFHASPWPAWAPWLTDPAQVPRDVHVQFLTELKRTSGVDAVRLVRRVLTQYLEHPALWAEYHRRATPLTVFSKSYCPFSKKAKALLDSYHARYDKYEVDLHRTSCVLTQPSRRFSRSSSTTSRGTARSPRCSWARIFWCVTVLTQGGNDRLEELDHEKLLHGILAGADVL